MQANFFCLINIYVSFFSIFKQMVKMQFLLAFIIVKTFNHAHNKEITFTYINLNVLYDDEDH